MNTAVTLKMPQIAWENRARKKRQSLLDAIPKQWRIKPSVLSNLNDRSNVNQIPRGLLTEDEIAITESTALVILENVHAGVWSAVTVTNAFCHRAALAHQLVNCLTEIIFDDALAQAEQLDNFKASTGGLKGPLHGLPMSFMDRYRVAGAETGSGYIAWLGDQETAQTESLLVQQLRSLGAIPFCKTNLPMSMMLGETSNNIMGTTVNPYVRELSSGGAAGGEAALLAMRGSPFGWGTEIAGSARIPASFNGIYALKVSHGRLSMKGVATNIPGSPVAGAGVGPLCADVASLTHVMKVMLCTLPVRNDPILLELPWRENKFREGQMSHSHAPIFAVLQCDQYVRPHPPVRRALQVTVNALRSQGFEVVEWLPPAHEPAVKILFQILGADGAKGLREALLMSGEPPVPTLRKWFYEQDTGSMSAAQFWDLCQSRNEYLGLYEDYWNSSANITRHRRPVDAVILPVSPSSGAVEGKLTYFGYSAIANFLDYAAGAFPVTFADLELDPQPAPVAPLSDEDRRVRATYDPAIFHGAPVGLQVMCRRLEEEKVLGLLSTITNALTLQQ